MLKNTLLLVLVLLAAPAWAQFRIPNAADAFAADQAEVDSVDIDILSAGLAGTGIISGCAVTAQASPDMTLAVASGSVKIGSTIVSVSAGNVTITTAHTTLGRFDLVVVNSSGTKSVTAGTASSNPSFPAIPANSVVLAAVYVPATDTTIEQNHVTDKRVMLNSTVLTGRTAGHVPYVASDGTLTSSSGLSYSPALFTATATSLSLGGTSVFGGEIQQATNRQIWNGTAAYGGLFLTDTQFTPDTSLLTAGTTSNSWHLIEDGDKAFDFQNGTCGTSACADPALIIHSHNQATNQYGQLSHNGTYFQILTPVSLQLGGSLGTNITSGNFSTWDANGYGLYLGAGNPARPSFTMSSQNAASSATGWLGVDSSSRYIVVGDTGDNIDLALGTLTNPSLAITAATPAATNTQVLSATGLRGMFTKTLTESAATSVVRIPVAAGAGAGGVFNYCVFASDATDQQQRCSAMRFSVTNKAATETCGMSNNAGTADTSITETEDGNAASISTGTLTYTITCDTTPSNAVDIQINAVSSLVQTTLQARGSLILVGPGEPLPQ